MRFFYHEGGHIGAEYWEAECNARDHAEIADKFKNMVIFLLKIQIKVSNLPAIHTGRQPYLFTKPPTIGPKYLDI